MRKVVWADHEDTGLVSDVVAIARAGLVDDDWGHLEVADGPVNLGGRPSEPKWGLLRSRMTCPRAPLR